jgi:hypothetical protein
MKSIEALRGDCRGLGSLLGVPAVLGALLGAELLCAQTADGARGGDLESLFDGTLAGWTIESTESENFSVADGVLRVEGPEGWLRSAGQYGDFLLAVEFRFVTDDADSGIFVRARPDAEFGRGWPNASYQVQLRNPVGVSRFPPVGGIFRHGMPSGETVFDAAVAERASSGTGQWQMLEVEVQGEGLTVRLNGTMLTRASGIANPTGHIGIQGETGVVEFRSIRIGER